MGDIVAKCILEEARQFMKGRQSASWSDYNYFKQKLIDAGCYGYEKALADILKL